MNYTLTFTKIKSNWLDHYENQRGKKNTYDKIGGYKGLYLYLTLYKFRIHNQDKYDTFITSIGLLRKETNYSTEEIFESLKLMKRAKVINISNCSRWDYLLDDDGKIRDKDVLIIEATDAPQTIRKEKTNRDGQVIKDSNGDPAMVDVPASDDDMYIGISFVMVNKYAQLELTKKNNSLDKYIALYCLINKWNNNIEGKAWMTIENMANILGFDKDYLHKMIIKMNKYYLMFSSRRRRKSGAGYYFEHYIANSEKGIEQTEASYGEQIRKWITKMEKKSAAKRTNVEESLPVTGEYDDTKEEKKVVKHGFGEKRAQVIGETDPFDDEFEQLIG